MSKIPSDISFKDHYKNFIYNSKIESSRLNNNMISIITVIDKFHNDMTACKEEIHNVLGISIDKYREYTNKEYNEDKTFYKKVRYIYSRKFNDDNSRLISLLLNYCQALERKNTIEKDIAINNIKVNMTYTKYQEYVFEYYNKVQEILLRGEGYKFLNNIGVIAIYRFKISKTPIRIDIKETNNRYKELIKNGKRPYNEAEAQWCKEHGVEYDGVKYKVNQIISHVHRIYITNTGKQYKGKVSFWSSNYINIKYRGYNYRQIAETFCKTLDDVFKLQVSLDIKLKILLIKFPGYFVNFVRDVNKQ